MLGKIIRCSHSNSGTSGAAPRLSIGWDSIVPVNPIRRFCRGGTINEACYDHSLHRK